METNTYIKLSCTLALLFGASAIHAQETAKPAAAGSPVELRSTYLLGPDDQITIRAAECEEINDKPVRVGLDGYIRLPLVGRARAGGLTVAQLETELMGRLKQYVREPEVAVTVTEFRSQPVSVIGSVKAPGIHQLQGRKTLIEILSLAGGLTEDAGPVVKVTRRLEMGRIPLPGAADDPTGEYSVAQVKLQAVLKASSPEQNIVIRPHDVISVPRAEMIYVTGNVMRSGGFVLNERESMSVLQALAMAGGLDRAASAKNSRILRRASTTSARAEIPVDLSKIMESRAEDLALKPDDILFIPSSVPKRAALRAVEAAIQTGTGIVIWRR